MVSLLTAVVRKSILFAQAQIEPFAEGAMNYLVRITRNGAWSAAEGEYDPTGEFVVYADPDDPSLGAIGGVMTTSPSGTSLIADEAEYTDSLTVVVPRSAPEIIINDMLQVMAGPDSGIVGRYFRVTSVDAGGRLQPSQTLSLTGVAKTRDWYTP